MKPEQINIHAYKYAERVLSKLNTLCAPLFNTPITIFAYFRFFNNGRYLYLCNNLDWVQFCLTNVHNNEGTSLGEAINHVPEDNYHCFLWPTTKTDYLMSALYDFDIWNGVSIFKQHENSLELWGFAANRKTDHMQNFYLENIELLKDFTASFNLTAAELIIPTEDNLAIYKDFKLHPHFDEYDSNIISEFINATPINKHPLITSSGEVFLSAKELNHLNLLALGKNLKQIAKKMKISLRTSEKHFENIKRKIGLTNKATIIEMYKDSVLNWL